MSLVTAAQIRDYLPQLSGTSEDTLLEELAAQADRLQAAWCHWPPTIPGSGLHGMSSATYTTYPQPLTAKPRALPLGHRFVASITSAHVDAEWTYGADTLVTSGDLVIDNELGLLWLKPTSSWAWSTADRANKVVYVAGFTDGSAPEGVIAATAITVRHMLMKRRSGEVETQSMGGSSITPRDADMLIPKAAQQALAPYKIWGNNAS